MLFPPQGKVRACQVLPSGERIWQPGPMANNQVMYEWATIVAKLLSLGDTAWRLSRMYLEFENLDDPETVVATPSFTRSDGVAYYASLAYEENKDYLSLPIAAIMMSSTDETAFPLGNKLTAFTQSAGVVGANGKTFSHTVNSKVYGGAIVASPVANDASQDLVYARFYLAEGDQQLKLAGSQVGLEYNVALG